MNRIGSSLLLFLTSIFLPISASACPNRSLQYGMPAHKIAKPQSCFDQQWLLQSKTHFGFPKILNWQQPENKKSVTSEWMTVILKTQTQPFVSPYPLHKMAKPEKR